MAESEKIGMQVALGEGFDLACQPIPACADEVDAFLCLRILRALRDVVFSTVDADGLPASRVIDVMAVEPGRLFFLAPRGKAFHDEMARTGIVSIVGQTRDLRMIRLRGRAIRPDDPEEQRRLADMMFALNPSMNALYPGDARRVIDAFYLDQGEGEYYDLGQQPLLRVPFALGDADREPSGRFVIDEACIGCGRCVEACPAACIEPGAAERSAASGPSNAECSAQPECAARSGAPFRIVQEHCLRCGLCAEACPTHAISKRTNRRA